MKLTGQEAIEYAEANGLTLSKYNDPIEDARDGLTVDEARKVASEDPSLIYVDAELLVIDPITDSEETAESCLVRPLSGGNTIEITDSRLIRKLYNDPSAKSYGEGSYSVC